VVIEFSTSVIKKSTKFLNRTIKNLGRINNNCEIVLNIAF